MSTTLRAQALFATACAAAVLIAAPASASAVITGAGPPAGNVILNLTGTPDNHIFIQYNAAFTATATQTAITFAFQDDPSFMILDNVVLSTLGGPNLILNGMFEEGSSSAHAPTDWTYVPNEAPDHEGVVMDGVGSGGTAGYYDGSSNGYDGISQTIATVIGERYNLSFLLNERSSSPTFMIGPDNEGTINLVVLADAVTDGSVGGVPEPATWALMILGFGGVGGMVRRQRRIMGAVASSI